MSFEHRLNNPKQNSRSFTKKSSSDTKVSASFNDISLDNNNRESFKGFERKISKDSKPSYGSYLERKISESSLAKRVSGNIEHETSSLSSKRVSRDLRGLGDILNPSLNSDVRQRLVCKPPERYERYEL